MIAGLTERERETMIKEGREQWGGQREVRMGCREEGGSWSGVHVSLFPSAGFTMVLMQC